MTSARTRVVQGPPPTVTTTRVVVLTIAMVGLLTAGWVLSGRLVREVPPLTVAAIRTASTLPVLTLLVLARPGMRAAARRATRRVSSLVVLAVLGIVVYYAGTMLGMVRIGAPATGIVVGLMPCLTFLIGVTVYRDRLRFAKLVGVVLAVGAAVAYGLNHANPAGTFSADPTGGAIGVALALTGTTAFALYGFAYRRRMGDLPALASLPGITAVGTIVLLPLVALVPGSLRFPADQLFPLIFLGMVFTAPVFLLANELMLLRGPLFTNSVAVCVPFLIRATEWALGSAPFFDAGELVLFTVAAVGVLVVIRADQPQPQLGRAS